MECQWRVNGMSTEVDGESMGGRFNGWSMVGQWGVNGGSMVGQWGSMDEGSIGESIRVNGDQRATNGSQWTVNGL